MSHPLDPDTTGGFAKMLAGHWPHVGAAATVAATAMERQVSLWHLVIAIVGVSLTLGAIIWALAGQLSTLQGMAMADHRDQDRQDGVIAEIRRRQEVNEQRIARLEVQTALDDQRAAAMERQHAEIYQALREARRR